MDTINRKVDEIWSRVKKRNADLINDWIQCFSSSDDESIPKAKKEVKLTLTRREYQTDPGKNFLWRLMSNEWRLDGYVDQEDNRKRSCDLATLFIQVVMEIWCGEDFVEKKIDEIWETVYGKNPDLMNDWIQCFSSRSYNEGKQKSKDEIKMTVTQREYQTDPGKNFLWRLMSSEPHKYGYVGSDGKCKRRADLAMLFIQVVMEISYGKDFVDKKIDEIWEKVYGRNPDLMNDWIQCFSISIQKAKQEVKLTLTRREYQTDPGKNFIWRLMSSQPHKYGYVDRNGECKRRADLAMLFLQVVMEISYGEDYIEERIDDIWETVSTRNPGLMNDWIQCFSSSDDGSIQKAKEEVKLTLTQREFQTNPGKNFLLRLMSSEWWLDGYVDKEGNRKSRCDLAMLFIQVMIENPVETVMKNTPLHEAARFEKVEEVKKLINAGEIMKINGQNNCTPLHYAALAINPKPEIAEELIKSVNGKQLLDTQTNGTWGQNTALHIAAGNINVTEEFIQQFKDANSQIHNSNKETPFHVAAKSRNRDAIVYMLNTFEPTNDRWDVDKVDVGQEPQNTLIKICARRGNAKAVALLIKHGADISEGVLHEIVLESVRNPHKIKKLEQVYRSIVDNAVAWRCLEKGSEFDPMVSSSDNYEEFFRETMIWLLTKPVTYYGKKDVLQCVMAHGASAMFWYIINTKSVFRIQGEKAWKLLDENNKVGVDDRTDRDETRRRFSFEQEQGDEVDAAGKESGDGENNDRDTQNWTVFDVTNFTKETMLKTKTTESDFSKNDSSEKSQLKGYAEPTFVENNSPEKSLLPEVVQQISEESVKPQVDQNSGGNKRNFKEPFELNKPYLAYLLTVFDQWKNSNILSTQPFRGLTKPYITLAQRFNFMFGLLQLIFMTSFTVFWMPTTCSLALMFNVSTTGCSSSASNNSGNALLPSFIQQRSWMAVYWSIWPIILIVGNVFITIHYMKQSKFAHRGTSNKEVVTSKDISLFKDRRALSVLSKLWGALHRQVPLRIFCIMVFLWLYEYFCSESHETYAEVTAMVLLFGWITNLVFFGAVNKSFSIFELVVKEIILKVIPSFMLFLAFYVVGFSFAMHTIRLSACMPDQIINLHDTFFAVFASAFGIGDYFETTVTDTTCAGGNTQSLFEFVYLGYVFVAMIILLNIVIAMMNNRYEKAKLKAENIWRFQTLSTMKALESHKCVWGLMNKFKILDQWRPDEGIGVFCCYVCCCYGDANHGKLIFKNNRWYLQLLLPVDER